MICIDKCIEKYDKFLFKAIQCFSEFSLVQFMLNCNLNDLRNGE